MSQNIFETVQLILALLFTALLIYRGFKISMTSEKLNNLIREKFEKDGAKIKGISKLTFTERLKYGVVPFDLFRIYNYYFGLLTGKLEYVRRIRIEKKFDDSETNYISITLKNGKPYLIKEFDSYKI